MNSISYDLGLTSRPISILVHANEMLRDEVRTTNGTIRIVGVPPGEAPLWVREKWLGLELPLAGFPSPGEYPLVFQGLARGWGSCGRSCVAGLLESLDIQLMEAAPWKFLKKRTPRPPRGGRSMPLNLSPQTAILYFMRRFANGFVASRSRMSVRRNPGVRKLLNPHIAVLIRATPAITHASQR